MHVDLTIGTLVGGESARDRQGEARDGMDW